MKDTIIENIKDSAKNNCVETLLFYMQESRDYLTPLEVARIYFKEICEYSIGLAYEIMEDMKDWA